MTYSRKILKSMEAHGGNPPMWFDHHEDYPNWENGSILNLMNCKEIWELHSYFIWNEENMNHTTENWFFEKHINTFCEHPKSIWHMQIGCESTGEYSQIFSSEDESLNAIKNNQIIWSAYYPICNSELDY